MNSADREQLDWLAFRYVAGELAPDEGDDFERRLADDQAARDAVSAAVALTHAIRLAEAGKSAPVLVVRGRRVWRSLRFAACLSACVLVAIVCHRFLFDRESGPADVSERPPATAAELAIVWSEARAEWAQPESDSLAWPEAVESGDPPSAAEEAAALVAPDWMFSAVVAVEADAEPSEKEDG